MKAAILHENKAPLIIDDIELPQTLRFGQVLVRLHYSGICGSQINEIDAAKGPDRFLPHLLGHEGSGVVESIGEGVKTVKKGDHVVLHWRQGDGLQSETPTYTWNGKKVNAGWVTTFNEKAVISENRLTVIPKEFDMKVATLFGCSVLTAMGVINNDASVKMGEQVVIFGLGGVGMNIAQAASLASAHPIIGIDLNEAKLKMSTAFGVTHGLNGKRKSLADDIRAIVGDRGADVVIDTTGNPRVIEQAYGLTHPDGKTILVGVPKKGDNVSIYTLPLHFKKVLTGSHGGSSDPHIDIPRSLRLYQAGKLKLRELITHEFDLGHINDAISLVRAGEAGRCVIKFS